MDVATFFTRLIQPLKEEKRVTQPDDINEFDRAWTSVKETLKHPDERQLVKGIQATNVPAHLAHIVDALVYESGQTDEDTTGACLEYLLRNDLIANLELLCATDRPRGIKGQVLQIVNNLIVSLSERFLVHNAVHRPLRRLLRSCIGDEPEEKVHGETRVFGAAGMETQSSAVARMDEKTEGDLLELMCTLASRMRAYPPLLLIFFHDKGWLAAGPTSGAPMFGPSRALSPTPSSTTGLSHPSSSNTKQIHHFEFLLFSYLLRFVHREGKTGDLARAGLQLLFDIAFLTVTEEGGENLTLPSDKEGNDPLQDARDAFGEYILDGDFPDVMAAGLGAVYSLLPTKLHVPTLVELAKAGKTDESTGGSTTGGMSLGARPEDHAEGEGEAPKLSTDVEVKQQLEMLARLLGFLQDILHRCRSPLLHTDPNDIHVSNTHVLGDAIASATLDAVHTSFLDNVIYPSILECSPDDGSAVAVMTYLEVIVTTLEDGPLLRRILDVLMNTYDPEEVRSQPRRGAGQDYYANEGRFTLKDLILDNVRSSSPSASTAALRFMNSLITYHSSTSVGGLLMTISNVVGGQKYRSLAADLGGDRSYLPKPVTSADAHLQETELYGSLISRIDPSQTSIEMSSGYAAYLTDVHAMIQADGCFVGSHIPLQFSAVEGEPDNELVSVGEPSSTCQQDHLSTGDPLLIALLDTFGSFLCQAPDQNVALTGVLASLAMCSNRSLSGWLTYDTAKAIDPRAVGRRTTMSDSESDMSEDDIPIPRQMDDDPFTTRDKLELPAVYQILRDIVRQVNRFRLDVEDFDRLLSERRQGLLFTDQIDEAMNVMLEVDSSAYGLPTTPTKLDSPSAKKARTGLVGGLKSFLTPKRKGAPATPSRASPLPRSASSKDAAGIGKTVSPLKSHYEQTSYLNLEAHSSPPISSGPWSRAQSEVPAEVAQAQSTLGTGKAASLASEYQTVKMDTGPKRVTLSSILDNCVILEEFLKEIVAIITARRALGVDQVDFVIPR